MKSVSVIIPTYKNRGGLVRSINSALSQDYDGLLEIIVVDDNDPNSEYRRNTETTMSQYATNPKVVYLKHNVNKNGAAARNTGIKTSKGDYIAFLDDDDMFLPGKIAKQVDYLNRHPQYEGVYCMAQRKGRPYGNDKSEGDCTREVLVLQTCIYTPCQMFRRKAIERIRGYDESFRRHQDFDLLLRFFHAGYKIGCIPEILTEIGTNEGENILKGEKLNELKSYFFDKFRPYIEQEDAKTPGFRKKVYAQHYAGVFLSHIKNGYYKKAFDTFCSFFFYSPSTFVAVIWRSIIVHLKGNA